MNSRQLQHTFIWLVTLAVLVFLMVVIGGITRLTHSGLSMVEWKPLMGTIPPLSEAAWLEVFHKYQQFPQYQLINQGMTLNEFKFIFFWEYFHRLFGRLIGLVFIVPFILFLLRGYYNRRWTLKLTIGFLLGGSQGLLGWYMVKSGLVENPFVSHYRLAAHLILATIILMYLTWLALETRMERPNRSWSFGQILLIGLLLVQITWGAFTAGRKAGFVFNTFPLMQGKIIPPFLFDLSPLWLNFFENNVGIQFLHRWLGISLLLVTALVWLKARGVERTDHRRWTSLLLALMVIQVMLGIATLVLVIPVPLASSHQALAMLLAISATGVIYTWPQAAARNDSKESALNRCRKPAQ